MHNKVQQVKLKNTEQRTGEKRRHKVRMLASGNDWRLIGGDTFFFATHSFIKNLCEMKQKAKGTRNKKFRYTKKRSMHINKHLYH